MKFVVVILTLIVMVSCSPKSREINSESVNTIVAKNQYTSRFGKLFQIQKPIIGVVNLQTLPGQKGFVSMKDSTKHAIDQMILLEEEGVDAVLFENVQGDFEATPEMLAAMTVITSEAVKTAKKIKVGVEVLWHDPKASYAIAKAGGAQFIRTDFFVDEMKADDRIIKEDPAALLNYRNTIGAEDVLIFTDVQVKYAEMVDPNKTLEQSALEAKNSGSDGVIVTGRKSGVPPSVERVKEVKKGASELEVILGSGTTFENAPELLSVADGAIVGTSISTKTGGVLVREKVRQFMDVVRGLR